MNEKKNYIIQALTSISKLTLLMLVVSLASSFQKIKKNIVVHNQIEFNQAVTNANAGDIIILSRGTWKDAELLFNAKGTKEQPIKLTVEKKGLTTLEGKSNLRICGEHLIVEGLVFKNGYTTTTEVVSFKKDNQNFANNCRLTECVIDEFNNPERDEQDVWVALYGKNNRVDHCHFEGKRNLGVLLAVHLNNEKSIENNHKIDHNYFAFRPVLGSNGGEIIRIGTSHFSMFNSQTIVEHNYFDRCDGENEIISNKSGRNIIRFNTFFECAGSLTLRHGNYAVVENNIFIGNGKSNTGGVRIINENQSVINNYFLGITGVRFKGALVIMNGVPNSPLNRYMQVKNAEVKNNIFINCDNIQFCAGKDNERSAVPINSIFSTNVFYHQFKKHIFTFYDDVKGIKFAHNFFNQPIDIIDTSFVVQKEMHLIKNDWGFLVPQGFEDILDNRIFQNRATLKNTGVGWYIKKDILVLRKKNVITVPAGLNTIHNFLKKAHVGDTLLLTKGEFYLTKTIPIVFPIVIKAANKNENKIVSENRNVFKIENGGSLSLMNVTIDGTYSPDLYNNSVITTSKYSMNKNYTLFIDNCTFENFNVNNYHHILDVHKNTFADTISISNTTFKHISGNILNLDKEKEDIGKYNAEYILLYNNLYVDIKGLILNVYRGGSDESTCGPIVKINHNILDDVGSGNKNIYKASMLFHGVQYIGITNTIWNKSADIKIHSIVGEPAVIITNNNFYETNLPFFSGDINYIFKDFWNIKPEFNVDYTNSNLSEDVHINKSNDGLGLGIIRN